MPLSAEALALGYEAHDPSLVGQTETSNANIETTAEHLTDLIESSVTMWDDKGAIDCSANPNYPAATRGDTYSVTVAGKIGGASGVDVQVQDVIRALSDNAGGTHATVGSSWYIVQGNLTDAMLKATYDSNADGKIDPSAGGTGADMSATGGTLHVVRQLSAGAAFTTAALVAADIPTLAPLASANTWAAAQGIRAAASGLAAGLYVPWITGDSLTTLLVGSLSSGNAMRGVWGQSNSGDGIQGQSVSGVGNRGISTSGVPLMGLISSALTNTSPQAMLLRHTTSGTPAAGFGLSLFFEGSSTTANRSLAEFKSAWVVAADASRTSRTTLSAYDMAARECLRLEASGTAPMVGFLGANAVVRQTLSAAATDPATTQTLVNDIRTALLNLGLAA